MKLAFPRCALLLAVAALLTGCDSQNSRRTPEAAPPAAAESPRSDEPAAPAGRSSAAAARPDDSAAAAPRAAPEADQRSADAAQRSAAPHRAAPERDVPDASAPRPPNRQAAVDRGMIEVLELQNPDAPHRVLEVASGPAKLTVRTENVRRLRIRRENVHTLRTDRSIALFIDDQGIEWLANSPVLELSRSSSGAWRIETQRP